MKMGRAVDYKMPLYVVLAGSTLADWQIGTKATGKLDWNKSGLSVLQ